MLRVPVPDDEKLDSSHLYIGLLGQVVRVLDDGEPEISPLLIRRPSIIFGGFGRVGLQIITLLFATLQTDVLTSYSCDITAVFGLLPMIAQMPTNKESYCVWANRGLEQG